MTRFVACDMSTPSHHPHDHFFRATFSQLEVVQDYLRSFLSQEIASALDLNSLTLVESSFLDNQLQEHFSDLVYKCSLAEGEVEITLLFEHKSYIPQVPWLQLLRYLVNAYENQANSSDFSGAFSPVIPIVIYHGKRKWQKRSISDYFHQESESFLPFIPEFTYELTSIHQFSDEQLKEMDIGWIRNVFLALKHSRDEDVLSMIRTIMYGLSVSIYENRESNFIDLIFVYLFKSGKKKQEIMDAIKKMNEPIRERAETIYDSIYNDAVKKGYEEGIQRGEEKGMEKGMEKGLKKGLEKGLEKGLVQSKFLVFKNGLKMGLSTKELALMTEISETLAAEWVDFIQQHPDAEFPD